MTLYASPYGGRRYHAYPTCGGLNSTELSMLYTQSVPAVTRADVVRRGLTPCRVCQPPPMLAVVPATSPALDQGDHP